MRKLLLALVLVLFLVPARAQRNTGYYEDYVQYIPLVMDLGLDLVGVRSIDGYPDILIATATSFLAETVMVNGLKLLIKEERPNGTAFNSFPSGHTATAFTGAELVRMEYGWGWGLAAYAAAVAVGYGRVEHQSHWWWDTAAGALIGVASAQIGYNTVRPIKRLFGWEMPREAQLSLAPAVDPFSGAVCTKLSFVF